MTHGCVVDWKGFRMSVYFMRNCGAALVLAISSHGAWADLTARDVWSDWRGYITDFGYEFTGTETMVGNTLKISDMGFSVTIPEEGMTTTYSLAEMSLVENSDGTVNITVPATQLMTIAVQVEDEQDVEIGIDYSQTGLSMVVSGKPGDMTYNFSAADLTLALASLVVDQIPMPSDAANAFVSFNNMSGSATMNVAGMRFHTGKMTASDVSFEFAAKDTDGGGMFKASGKTNDVDFSSAVKMPLNVRNSDVQAMLKSGFEFESTFGYGISEFAVMGSGDGADFSANGSLDSGAFQITVDQSKLAYDVHSNGLAVSAATSDLPFPLSFELAKYGLRLGIPMANSTSLQDFALGLTLQDLSMADHLWSMIDPAGNLPHDPATVAVDLSGKTRVLVDFLSPDIEETMQNLDHPPAEVHALTIKEFLVSALGARLSGIGDFTFDNDDLATFDGLPAPTGSVSLDLVGANGLLDKLIAMGIISDNDAMGGRMMIGMLAVPGDGDDTLKSTLEITAEGHILANGQRIK